VHGAARFAGGLEHAVVGVSTSCDTRGTTQSAGNGAGFRTMVMNSGRSEDRPGAVQGKSRPQPLLRVFGGVAIAVVLTAGCARSDDPTAPQPKKVYKDAFETPITAVEIEADGGSIVGAYDAWLRLLPSQELTARFAAEYRPIDCAPVRVYFGAKLAFDGLALADSTLSCREYRNSDLPFENGRWLAEDTATGRVHYRIWKFR
jgi:hypothetical protein